MKLILSLIVVFFVMVSNCHAYLDPGSGSFLFQFVLAIVFGVLYYFKSIIKRIKNIFKNIFSKTNE